MRAKLLVVIAFMIIYPPPVGQGQTDMIKLTAKAALQKQKFDSLTFVAKSEIKELEGVLSKPAIKVIYRTETRRIKPRHITLYVREANGDITEHAIKAKGGFYIIDVSDIIDTTKFQRIQFKDTIIKHRNLIQRLFNL